MKIKIIEPQEQRFTEEGLVVVIDVFRAFSTSCFIVENNPERIIPVSRVDEAFALRDEIENSIIIGERAGVKIDGFDYGNSPAQVRGLDFSGKTVIHTTTCGTRGLLNQIESNDVVTGSFVNCGAVVKYIRRRSPENVYLYCTAENNQIYGEEDYFFADFLKARLEGRFMDFEKIKKRLRAGSGAGFREGGFAPEHDFHCCMDLDRSDWVLKRKYVGNRNYEIELKWVKI